MTDQEEKEVIQFLKDYSCFDPAQSQLFAIAQAMIRFGLTEDEVGRIYHNQMKKGITDDKNTSSDSRRRDKWTVCEAPDS